MAAACSELLMSPCTCMSALQPAVMLLLIHELLHALAWQHQWLWIRSRVEWSDLSNVRLQLKETAVASTTGCTCVATLERLVQSVRSAASQSHTRQEHGEECTWSLISLPCATCYRVSTNLSSLQLVGSKILSPADCTRQTYVALPWHSSQIHPRGIHSAEYSCSSGDMQLAD